jgi:hypothetical protein
VKYFNSCICQSALLHVLRSIQYKPTNSVYTVLIDKGYMSAVIAGGAAAAYEVFDPCLRLPLAHGVNALYPSDDGTAGLPK